MQPPRRQIRRTAFRSKHAGTLSRSLTATHTCTGVSSLVTNQLYQCHCQKYIKREMRRRNAFPFRRLKRILGGYLVKVIPSSAPFPAKGLLAPVSQSNIRTSLQSLNLLLKWGGGTLPLPQPGNNFKILTVGFPHPLLHVKGHKLGLGVGIKYIFAVSYAEYYIFHARERERESHLTPK